RAVASERNIRQRDRGGEGRPALSGEEAAEPITVDQAARQRIALLELRQIPDAVDDEAMTLVGRRGGAIRLQVELIEEARAVEGRLRTTAPAVARARQVLGLCQRVSEVEWEAGGEAPLHFKKERFVISLAERALNTD